MWAGVLVSESRSHIVDLCRASDLMAGQVRDRGIRPLPGRAVLQMVKPGARGGVLLPDKVRHCCDVGRLLAGEVEGASVGDHLVVRPYAGLWASFDEPLDGRLLGVGDPLWHSVVGVWDGEALSPLGPWALVRATEGLLGGVSTKWWEVLKAGPECPDWVDQADGVSKSAYSDVLFVGPGFGLDNLALICTRS